MNEFELIEYLQLSVNRWAEGKLNPPVLGIGDDAAVLSCPDGLELVVTMDTLVSGVHFNADADAVDIAHKALAVNLSDLAAMGAAPGWYFLALTLPAMDETWLKRFSEGLAALSERAEIQLAGGDTTSGPLSITITALGWVDSGRALGRSGAQKGDLVVVSGTPGLAAFALEQIKQGKDPGEDVLQALHRPEPRLALGRALPGLATACIDISDGLAADLSHICEASAVGAAVNLHRLPVAEALNVLSPERRWEHQLGGGDDYELCFTLPPEREADLRALAGHANTSLTVIGVMTADREVAFLREDKTRYKPSRAGFDHFAGLN